MSNKISIRDPIHNYIYMTNVEESIVKHPLFQRLRHISQNSSAYYTYPANRHDRFLHSLGVMKIGGDIFLNATENYLDKDVRKFMRESYRFIKRKAIASSCHIETIANQLHETKDLTFVKYGLGINNDWAYVVKELDNEESYSAFSLARAILFQSLRIACVLHDVGHFPYSHTIEYAIKDYISVLEEKSKENEEQLNEAEASFLEGYLKFKEHLDLKTDDKDLHEMIGIKLLDEILPSANLNEFNRLCRTLAKEILAEEGNARILLTLHRIVSGELDADRLDYSLRDPYSSGLEFGKIDMDRLLNSFVLVENEGRFDILPKVQALSSIETFFHHRYLSYKYLIYHHNKTRMDGIIAEIMTYLIKIHFNSGQKTAWIEDVLEKNNFNFLLCKINDHIPVETERNDYYYCDEAWFNNLIKQIYIKKDGKNISDEIGMLLLLIGTFIFRKTDNIISLFKRYDSYIGFFENICSQIEGQTPIDLKQYDLIKECVELISGGLFEDFRERIWKEYKIILLVKMTPAKSISFRKDGNTELKVVVGHDKKVEFINKFSPYLESMKLMNDADQLFHIF